MLWADAVCVNQEDNLERGKQVGIMSDIYSLAMRTLVFLGEAADNSEMDLNLLEEIARAYIDNSMGAKIIDPIEFCLFGLPPDEDPALESFENILGTTLVSESVDDPGICPITGCTHGLWYVAGRLDDILLSDTGVQVISVCLSNQC